MSPEQFRQVEELYHAAREGTPDQRAALLARTDPELRREVESLLSDAGGGEFLDLPAIRNAPELLEGLSARVLTAGICLGPYRIVSKLGEGGMGQVFRAVDTRLGRDVAVKTTRVQFTSRFEREARAIAALNHPNICTLHDVGPDYLVMELVEGETIAARLKTGPLPINTALLYASQIAAALSEAHSRGVVHRDLKPGNIMIARSGIKVLDFGLARSGQDATVTASSTVIGTPAYMAPEQREGKPADARSDIYSFGCVLYEMFTGASVSGRRKRLPSRRLESIVDRCLEEDPARRWQSFADVQRELARAPASGRRWMHVLAAAGALALFSAAAYFYIHRTPKLTAADTIVLADFVNNTGDPIFDGTLRQGLAIQLEQSPFLKILDDQQMRGVLPLMGRPADARITSPLAREICVREGAAATIDAAIVSLGRSYVITLQAITCQNSATLAREQIQAPDKEHVLNAVGSAATAMRARLGESLNSIQQLNRPLEQATTHSLEALQNYSAGYSEMMQGHSLAALPFLEHAIAIDPNFAMAYQFIGVAFSVAGDDARSREYTTKAFSLIGRVSEYERDVIAESYYYETDGELDKTIDACRLAIRNYPRTWVFHNSLSAVYIDVGRYEEALKEGVEATRLQANAEPAYRRQLDALICTDRLPEARQLAEKVRAQGLDRSRIHQRFLEMAYLDDDRAAVDRETQWFRGKPEEYLSFGLQAADRNVHGRRRESHAMYQRAAEAALHRGLRNAASEFEEADARAAALSGDCRPALRLGRPALALAMCGDASRAEEFATATSRLFPHKTLWNAVQLPEIRAAIALHAGQPARSVEVLAAALPYERANLEAIYLRGLAYLRLRKGPEAAAEFHKIIDHAGANWASAWRYPYWGQVYALSFLGAARASALTGDTEKAKEAFRNFFALWKDADRDLPILQQAKTDYAKL